MIKASSISFLFFIISIAEVFAEKSKKDISRDYLIQRLESLYKTLGPNDFMRKPMTLRLAHILSLRAEDHISRQEEDKSCQDCSKLGLKDAKRSLFLYAKMFPVMRHKHPVLYSESLFKVAYLHRMIGEESKSISYLKQIINLKTKKSFLVRAYFNLGEIYFESYKYNPALRAFNKVIQKGQTPWEFKAYYHKVWSLYNIAHYNQSIAVLEKFLNSDLYKKGRSNENNAYLRQKLQKELVVLYARSQLTDKRIEFFYNFDKDNPEDNTKKAKNQRLFDLAEDLNRIGRSRFSNKVWTAYLNKKDLPHLNQIKAYTSMVNNYFVINDASWILEAGPVVEKLLTLKDTTPDCPKKICDNIYKQVRRYMDEIHRQSKFKKHLNPYLLTLYGVYNQAYPNEYEMLVRSAFLAKKLKKHALAQDLFQKSAMALQTDLEETSDKKKVKALRKDLEQVSLLQMEMAELTGKSDRKYQAYNFYLKNGQNQKAIYEVKYQYAYTSYENKKYKEASKLFKDLALFKDAKGDKKIESLALKSAHLALSCLNFLKNKDLKMGEWATLFNQRFPQEKDFVRIYNTSVFNRIKKLLSHFNFNSYPLKPSKDRDLLKAWAILNSVKISKLNKVEKNKYYMNKLFLEKELLKLSDMRVTIDTLLNIPSLPKEDQKVVLTWKLWLAEIRFDFAEVLKLVKDLNPKKKDKSHDLRLAYLAELSNQDYVSYYQAYLTKYPKSKQNLDIVKHIIEKTSKNKKRQVLNQYLNYFKKKPEDLSYLVLKIDNNSLDIPFISSFLKLSFMKNSSLDNFIKRKSFIESFNKTYKEVQKFSLNSRSQSQLTRSIKTYKDLLDRLETAAKPSVKTKDWLAQVVAFSGVHNELVRFYESILKLPLPKGLNLEEETEYLKLIEAQITPYRNRANQMKKEIDKLLQGNFVKKYSEMAKKQQVFHGILKWEMKQLVELVPDKKQHAQINDVLYFISKSSKKSGSMVSQSLDTKRKINEIYLSLKEDPFNKSDLNELLKLEESENNSSMAYYLMNRIEKIKKSKRGRVKL